MVLGALRGKLTPDQINQLMPSPGCIKFGLANCYQTYYEFRGIDNGPTGQWPRCAHMIGFT